MNWDDIEKELRNRPQQNVGAADAFWSDFRERVKDEPRNESVPEPIAIGRWLAVAAAAAAVLVAVLPLRPAPVETAMRIASTEVKSVDVVASHGGVIIMTNEDAGGTVLWIADLDLNQIKEDE